MLQDITAGCSLLTPAYRWPLSPTSRLHLAHHLSLRTLLVPSSLMLASWHPQRGLLQLRNHFRFLWRVHRPTFKMWSCASKRGHWCLARAKSFFAYPWPSLPATRSHLHAFFLWLHIGTIQWTWLDIFDRKKTGNLNENRKQARNLKAMQMSWRLGPDAPQQQLLRLAWRHEPNFA